MDIIAGIAFGSVIFYFSLKIAYQAGEDNRHKAWSEEMNKGLIHYKDSYYKPVLQKFVDKE